MERYPIRCFRFDLLDAAYGLKTLDYSPTMTERAHRGARLSIWRSLWANSDAADAIEAEWFRNPFHDFTFYWLGLVGLQLKVVGIEPGGPFRHGPDGNEDGGCNVAFTIPQGGWLPRPFVSWAGRWIAAYVGWRPPSGAFGLKLRRNSRG